MAKSPRRKPFFQERNPVEIRGLNVESHFTGMGLVEHLMGIDPSVESLEVRVQVTPGHYFRPGNTGARASRLCYKHGQYVPMQLPRTRERTIRSQESPQSILRASLYHMSTRREDEISQMGYSIRPVQGPDRRRRFVPFVWALEAARLFAYSETVARGEGQGIEVVQSYDDAVRVETEGASVSCLSPSRTQRKERYNLVLHHVPIEDNNSRLAIATTIKSDFENQPEHREWNIRFPFASSPESADFFAFYPHDMAAFYEVARHYAAEGNKVPAQNNFFLAPSAELADFYMRLCNNVLVYDRTLSGKQKTRKPHLDEKSILLARAVGVLGIERSFHSPGEKIAGYNWNIPGK